MGNLGSAVPSGLIRPEEVLTGPEPQNPALPLPAFLSGTSLLFPWILVLKGPNPTGFHRRVLFFKPPGSNLLRPPVGFLTGPAGSSGVDSWCFTRLFSVGFNHFPPADPDEPPGVGRAARPVACWEINC